MLQRETIVTGAIMQIRDGLIARKLDSKATNTTSTKNGLSVRTIFSAELLMQEKEVESYDRDIEALRKEIEEAGVKLENEPTIPNFKNFREILSKLAKRIGTEAYRLEKCGGTPQNPRYYEIITTINVEADKLYNLIVQEQRNNMAITAKVIGIKGLVVDLIT
jgi:uncharacterized protein YaaR (DUF327 family)